MKIFRVRVEHFTTEKELQVPCHMGDQEAEQHQTRYCHHDFLADRGSIKKHTTG